MIQPDPFNVPAATHQIALPLSPKQIGWILQIPVLSIVIVMVVVHYGLWGAESFATSFNQRPMAGIALLIAYPLGIIIHELLHAVGFAGFGGAPWHAIRFGFYRMAAYCQCDTPISVTGYRSAVALPGMALGLFPAAVGFSTGLAWLSVFGAMLTAAALGDLMILWALRAVPGASKVVYRPHIARYEVLL